jgi:RNA polymerase sigma factor (sigma-70 family)
MKTNEALINQLLLQLEPRQASPEARYKELRFKMVKFFAWRRCEDPELLADETVSRAISNITEGQEIRSENPYSYIYAIAKNVYREHLREKARRDDLPDDLPAETPADWGAVGDCRRECFERLSPDKRHLLYEYYFTDKSREQLANERGMTVNALRLQIHRIKNELRACYEGCLKSQG